MDQLWSLIYQLDAVLFAGTLDNSSRTRYATWALGILAFALILRTYIAPFIIGLVSTRASVRSISFRSIRGLYLRTSTTIWRAERIKLGWRWSSKEKTIRITFTVEGLYVDVLHLRRQKSKVRKMVPTMAAQQTWSFMSSTLGRISRTAARTWVVLAVRAILFVLPGLTQVMELEFDTTNISFKGATSAQLVIKKTVVRSHLAISQSDESENVISAGSVADEPSLGGKVRRRFGSLWTLLSTRNAEKAWAATQCAASISVKMEDISGLLPGGPKHFGRQTFNRSELPLGALFAMPQGLQFACCTKLSPSQRKIELRSIVTSLDFGTVHLCIDTLRSLLAVLEEIQKSKEVPKGEESTSSISSSPTPRPSPQPLSPSLTAPAIGSHILPSPEQGSPSPLLGSQSLKPKAFQAAKAWKWAADASRLKQASEERQSGNDLKSPKSRSFEALKAWRWAANASRLRNVSIQNTRKPRQHPGTPWLSYLSQLDIRIPAIIAIGTAIPLRAEGRRLAMSVGLGDPTKSELHREHLGSNTTKDSGASEAYAIIVSFEMATIDRIDVHKSPEPFRVLHMGPLNFQSVIHNWPAPLLVSPPSLAGDPNAALLLVQITLDSVTVTENLESLQNLLSKPRSFKPASPPPAQPSAPRLLLPVPRIQFDMHVGNISGTLICPDNRPSHKYIVLEARTEEFNVRASSVFSAKVPNDYEPDIISNETPVRMGLEYFAHLGAVSLSTYTSLAAELRSTHGGESILLLDPLELSGDGKVLGYSTDDPLNYTTLDLDTAFIDAICSTEALSVELWNSDVIAAISLLAALSPTKPAPIHNAHPVQKRRILDRLPFGVAIKFGVRRCTAIVTAADVSPEDRMELSRGLALRTSLSFIYCAVRPNSRGRPETSHTRSQIRAQLYLPAEKAIQASAAAKTHQVSEKEIAFVQLAVRGFSIRSAVATHWAADDPYWESTEATPFSEAFIRIPEVICDLELQDLPFPLDTGIGVVDHCEASVTVRHVRADVSLAHIYSALLAAKRISSFGGKRQGAANTVISKQTISFSLIAAVQNVQIVLDLPFAQRLSVRTDAIEARSSSTGAHSTNIKSIYCWIPKPESEHWEEFIRIQNMDINVPHTSRRPIGVTVHGGARLCLPHRFMFHELVKSISVAAKALKHLSQVITIGTFAEMPSPESEGPKKVPNLHIRIHAISIEADDDPFETKLALAGQTGLECAKVRNEREDAFEAKSAAIRAAEGFSATGPRNKGDHRFDASHTVSIEDAHQRLQQVHSMDWMSRHREAYIDLQKREKVLQETLWGPAEVRKSRFSSIIKVDETPRAPPLFRAELQQLNLNIGPPSFAPEELPKFLEEKGGLPLETTYSLLVPIHLMLHASSLRVTLRDYPIPMLNIPTNGPQGLPALELDMDLVIAEEMGSDASVDWVACAVLEPNYGVHGASGFTMTIPKTVMPVKSYASPIIRIKSKAATDLSWAVCYGPAIQDLMRVLDTLSSPPQDPSPPLGFWDKIRLQLHWRIRVVFSGDVHLYLKGTRDPRIAVGHGAGFMFCWQGDTGIDIGYENEQKELIQVSSDRMLIGVPDLEMHVGSPGSKDSHIAPGAQIQGSRKFRKICAKFSSSVRFGLGAVLERTCGSECAKCSGLPFDRRCRFFKFAPHHKVQMRKRSANAKDQFDSFRGFRSDFIHMSVSLSSGLRRRPGLSAYSSFHLTPQVFAHFWSWWSLFDRVLTLPVRQGAYWSKFSSAKVSPKLGKHLATIKYRIDIPHLFISHVYVDDSKEAWKDGVTPFVGIKALIDRFRADLHQREEEATSPGVNPGDPARVIVRKPFCAAEVVMKGLDLRALLAVFPEPMKQSVVMDSSSNSSNYRSGSAKTATNVPAEWDDPDDFVDLRWAPVNLPSLHMQRAAACPQFTYFMRVRKPSEKSTSGRTESSKFGDEDTHVCLLGTEASMTQVQIDMATARISELQRQQQRANAENDTQEDQEHRRKMIDLLRRYIVQVQENADTAGSSRRHSYHMPADSVQVDEWADFDNVYQVHCPKIFMTDSTRDILMQYYYCSQARRGFEYHMATRAVKFIRDQAQTTLSAMQSSPGKKRARGAVAGAQNAANALLKMLNVDAGPKLSLHVQDGGSSPLPDSFDPLSGWSEGVSLQKGHFCLLVKPQIVLQCEVSGQPSCVLAAVDAKLQSFAILDDANAADPISGKVMTRTYASLHSLQMFSPSRTRHLGVGYVPLEVLVDLLCESQDFDRVVPQTDATFHYDKFNRLRLRNNVSSVVQASSDSINDHLQHQTDLVRVHVPRFTVAASGRHFESIADIVTNLILHSDSAHKIRADKLETMLFRYDFSDLTSAALVVGDFQARLRQIVETENLSEAGLHLQGDQGRMELLKIKAHALSVAEELTLIFDAIKLAQDKVDEHSDQKSALLLRTSSSEISWMMLDERKDLLAKLAVRDIDYSWLSRQDSSTVNKLVIGDLQAFAGSPHATWPEILSKHSEPSSHPLCKRGCFMTANWTLLPAVGGITIYENFEALLHPMRLQVDTRIGRRLMEYVWPDQKKKKNQDAGRRSGDVIRSRHNSEAAGVGAPTSLPRKSLEALSRRPDASLELDRLVPPPPPLRKLSRSFTDLRSANKAGPRMGQIQRGMSLGPGVSMTPIEPAPAEVMAKKQADGDAEVMRSRSSQKQFVMVRVGSLNLLLSIMKEQAFLCRDARIQTRDLEYRNQTLSFEELVSQFIPSDSSWKGWVKMALHQPLVPLLPVARELFTKTKWIASKGGDSNGANGHAVASTSNGQASKFRLLHGRSRRTPSTDDTPSSKSAPPDEAVIFPPLDHQHNGDGAVPSSDAHPPRGNLFKKLRRPSASSRSTPKPTIITSSTQS